MTDILSFCREIGYPEERAAFFDNAYRALCASGGEPTLDGAVTEFFAERRKRTTDILPPIEGIAEAAGIHVLTLHALFVMRAFLAQREEYTEKYGEEVFLASAGDLVCKTEECVKSQKVIGITTLSWFNVFLRQELFSLGRLQFHIVPFRMEAYNKCGLSLREGDPVINVHIPSSGRLPHEACLDAYRRAYRFFRDRFAGDVLPFVCGSWMLYHRNLEFFPEGGNLVQFMADYDIIHQDDDPENKNLWRVFGEQFTDYSLLPRTTRLQAALADYLQAGNAMGHGYGVFAHNGEKILK